MSTVEDPGSTGDLAPGPDDDATELERRCWDAIDEIPDPHMPVSIVELGMIYDVRFDDGTVTVEMTFPCMGCPAYGMLQDDVRGALRAFEEVEEVTIDIVWDPVWTKDMLAEDVREQLTDWGIAL